MELGWYTRGEGPFNVNAIYGDGKLRWKGVAWVEDEMKARAARPEKVTLEDVFWSIQTERLTGDTAGYGQVVPLIHPADPALRMMWHAAIGPVTAPLLPVFLGQGSVPEAYVQHRYLTTGESARFLDRRKEEKSPDTVSHVPQGVETAESAVYQYKRLMHLAFQAQDSILAEVWSHWRTMEEQVNAELSEVLRAAELLIDAGEGGLAERVMTEFSHRCLRVALDDCTALAEAAQARLRVAGRLNLTGKPMAPEQLW